MSIGSVCLLFRRSVFTLLPQVSPSRQPAQFLSASLVHLALTPHLLFLSICAFTDLAVKKPQPQSKSPKGSAKSSTTSSSSKSSAPSPVISGPVVKHAIRAAHVSIPPGKSGPSNDQDSSSADSHPSKHRQRPGSRDRRKGVKSSDKQHVNTSDAGTGPVSPSSHLGAAAAGLSEGGDYSGHAKSKPSSIKGPVAGSNKSLPAAKRKAPGSRKVRTVGV